MTARVQPARPTKGLAKAERQPVVVARAQALEAEALEAEPLKAAVRPKKAPVPPAAGPVQARPSSTAELQALPAIPT